jgi:hypothetical protein
MEHGFGWLIGYNILNCGSGQGTLSSAPVTRRCRIADRNIKPVRFRITIDGQPPEESRGTDVNANGEGMVTEQRLYQLIRQNGAIADHTFEIKFLDPGVNAYAFTFG